MKLSENDKREIRNLMQFKRNLKRARAKLQGKS
jgi:hypothetical protein